MAEHRVAFARVVAVELEVAAQETLGGPGVVAEEEDGGPLGGLDAPVPGRGGAERVLLEDAQCGA